MSFVILSCGIHVLLVQWSRGEIKVGTKCAVGEKKSGSGVLSHRDVRLTAYKNPSLSSG